MSVSRHLWAVLAILSAVMSAAAEAWAGAYISKISGIVQARRGGSERWDMVKGVPLDLQPADSVRTGSRAQATLMFEDGSRIELGPNAAFTLESADAKSSGLKLNLGSVKAFIKKLQARRFEVRTPTAVCAVRGTEFSVSVLSGGRTVVDLYKGLLAVTDHRGQQMLLRPNERLQIDLRGMGSPAGLPSQTQLQQSQFHSVMRREMTLDMSKEEVQAAAAREIKLAEFQQGKALIDAFGQRVRLEEYIIRPSPNQFKLVVLNERASRFDYFYYLGTFNATLPQDLSVALRQLPGKVGSAPDFFLTAFETGRSNTRDSMIEIAQGGHSVDVNNNSIAGDNVSFFYDAAKDKFVDVSGQSVFQTLFDKYGFYINGKLKYGWSGSNIQSYDPAEAVSASTTDPITGAALAAGLPARSVSVTFPSSTQIHQVIYESYSDGTFTKWDNYIIDDEGRIATLSDFQGATSGTSFKERLLNFNYEQVVTATEFEGRKIDLVVEPKILIQAGLIQ